jgi:hypothetical protein
MAGLPFLKLNLSKMSYENGLKEFSKDFVLKKTKLNWNLSDVAAAKSEKPATQAGFYLFTFNLKQQF